MKIGESRVIVSSCEHTSQSTARATVDLTRVPHPLGTNNFKVDRLVAGARRQACNTKLGIGKGSRRAKHRDRV